jgi:nuclear transport factor 2 (NTF2) superfamily protein
LNVFHPEWLGILSENPRCFDERDTIMPAATITTRPLLPPFTRESATQKVRMAEDSWNTRDPEKVALAYTIDSRWRNRSEFIRGRTEIMAFLSRKWARELDYRLIKELWAFTDNRIAVRFAYEWHDDSGHWYRAYGNEKWEFNCGRVNGSAFCIHR